MVSQPSIVSNDPFAPLAYRLPQAAVRAGVSVKTMQRLVYEKKLPSFKLGGARLIHAAVIDKLIADAMAASEPAGAGQ